MATGSRFRLSVVTAILFIAGCFLCTSGKAQSAAPQANQPKHPGPPCVPLADVAPGNDTSHSDPGQNDSGQQSTPVQINREVCVRAHVYDVVELTDGRRFLDVCPAEVPDDQCRFVLLSLPGDRDEVGDLRRYRNQEVQLRGILRTMHGRVGIVISHARQFNGGPEKFRPNPRLLRDFNGQSDRMPVRDPNLSPAGHHRSFMDTKVKETLPPAKQ